MSWVVLIDTTQDITFCEQCSVILSYAPQSIQERQWSIVRHPLGNFLPRS